MKLEIGKQQEVNQEQYRLIQKRWSWLIAYRREGDKFFIKPLTLRGYRERIEDELANLETLT